MAERFDVIVLGMGPGGEVVAGKLLASGKKVAVVERELIGGECGYWACIPSKTLLRPPEARAGAQRAAGTRTPDLDWPEASAYRDYMIRHLDDAKQVESYEEQGATVFKGAGRITAPGTVEVNGRLLRADHIVVATGSDASIPPIDGLRDVPVWTNREATTLKQIPERAVLVGGGPVGVELGQMLARFGAQVTIVQSAARLMDREDPRVGELIASALREEGIDIRVGRKVTRARKDGADTTVELDDRSTISADVIVIGTGRTPRTRGIGLEAVGIEPGEGGLPIDETCRLAEGLWAVGDVTGVLPFTHVAKYQARIVASTILGKPARADYRSIPRVVFSDPEIAGAGLTAEQARGQGLDVATATVSLPEALARPWTYEREPRGEMGLVADRERGVLVGAWAVAPLSGEWIHQACVAIRAEIPITTLLDTAAQFPTYSEAYLIGLEKLGL
ncbi:MAG: NAD(P)/FAD-dependent oxidoreductase [Actinomycetota bacterium]|nr:NAD(P)/FAD-dependent oxidoreductase [Actinomycetota bacterium]